jgi:hypothetical protein
VSALLLFSAIGTLAAGWNTRARFKALFCISTAALLIIWATTPTVFWPLIQELLWVRRGRHPLGPQAASALAAKWIIYDWLRTVFIALGFAASLRAISIQQAWPEQVQRPS